jgi:O-antigen/teichoic acid export membrane protein
MAMSRAEALLNSRFLRPSFEKLAQRFRQKNTIYLALSMFARVLNALGMFLALQRFAPSTFGEMSYLMATAVSTVSFCAFGIELSMNAELTRKLTDSSRLAPTVLAGCVLALTGIIVACLVICTIFAPQLRILSSPALAVAAVCIYSSFMILTSLCTSMAFALHASVDVGVSYIVTSGIFVLFAIFGSTGVSGVGLMFYMIAAQLVAVPYMAISLWLRNARLNSSSPAKFLPHSLREVTEEIKTLLLYGAKQILIVSAVTFSQWLIQRKIVFGDGGASENAVYSVGNQIFNMMNFIPAIITPILVTRLAAAGSDIALRRRICLRSLQLFGVIVVCACAGTVVGLRLGTPFLPPSYSAAVLTGFIASVAAAFQVMKTPFSLYFLSELKASREIASSAAGALFMIVATSLFTQLDPDQGTTIRLLGCALQAVLLCGFFLIETRGAGPARQAA